MMFTSGLNVRKIGKHMKLKPPGSRAVSYSNTVANIQYLGMDTYTIIHWS